MRKIIKVWKRSQHVINKWKQWLCNNKANSIFAIFTHSKDAKALLAVPFEYMPDFKNKMIATLLHLDARIRDLEPPPAETMRTIPVGTGTLAYYSYESQTSSASSSSSFSATPR